MLPKSQANKGNQDATDSGGGGGKLHIKIQCVWLDGNQHLHSQEGLRPSLAIQSGEKRRPGLKGGWGRTGRVSVRSPAQLTQQEVRVIFKWKDLQASRDFRSWERGGKYQKGMLNM